MSENSTCSAINDLHASFAMMIDKIIIPEPDAFDIKSTDGNYQERAVDKKNEDLDRPLKSVATDIVVNEFFKNDSSLYQFLSITSRAFEKALQIYSEKRGLAPRDLLFIYKGGNILRIVSKEFLLELPNSAIRELDEYYKPFFRRGDADFGIYVNPYLENYEKIFHEVTLLAYILQAKLRTIFLKDLSKYFDFFKYNQEYQSKVLFPYLEAFNNAEGFKNEFIDFKIGDSAAVGDRLYLYHGNVDVSIDFINPDEDWTLPVRQSALLPIYDSNSIMTITYNNALDFAGGSNEVREKFNLARTKFIFSLLRRNGTTKNIGGELIDVGTQHRLSSSTKSFFSMIDSYITSYRLLYKDVCDLTFNAYSLKYLIYDLENILFSQRPYPWVDSKYKKRLNRLIYMHFVSLFVSLEDGNSKMRILFDLVKFIFIPCSKINSYNAAMVSKLNMTFQNKYFGNDQYSSLELKTLCVRLFDLIKKLREEDFAPMRELGEVMIENGKFLLSSLENIKNYCSVDGRVSISDLEKSSFDSLI